MATRLYPPLINGTIPAFCGATLVVPFSFNRAVSVSDVVKMVLKIRTVNGDLKETKSFMMSLNDDNDTFVFDGIIKGSESVVQHLDKTKNAVNQTADAINALKNKSLYVGFNGNKFVAPKSVITKEMVDDIAFKADIRIHAIIPMFPTEDN